MIIPGGPTAALYVSQKTKDAHHAALASSLARCRSPVARPTYATGDDRTCSLELPGTQGKKL